MVILSTSPGDGSLSIDVDSFGAFGSSFDSTESGGSAILNPVGEIESVDTVFESSLAIDIINDDSPERVFISQENFTAPEFSSVTDTTATSGFSYSGLDFSLEQQVFDLNNNEERTGSNLRQTYTITNSSTEVIDFELIRYLDADIEDGDTDLDAGIIDNGRRFFDGETEVLFQTDSSANGIYVPVLVGFVTNGVEQGESYEINGSTLLRDIIVSGEPLLNSVEGDGDDADQLTDEPYEASLAVGDTYSLQPGESVSYENITVFNSGGLEDGSDIFPLEGGSEETGGDITGDGIPVYRFFRTDTQTQFYTTSEAERDVVLDTLPQYDLEGISFVGAPNVDPLTGTSPVYRFFNSDTGIHLYTADVNEAAFVDENLSNYTLEGTPYYGYDTPVEGTVPLYRFYNADLDAHFYTPNAQERDFYAESPDYEPEGGGDGIAFYVEPAF